MRTINYLRLLIVATGLWSGVVYATQTATDKPVPVDPEVQAEIDKAIKQVEELNLSLDKILSAEEQKRLEAEGDLILAQIAPEKERSEHKPVFSIPIPASGKRIVFSRNDIIRTGLFGAELWALSRMYESFADQRLDFVCEQVLAAPAEHVAILKSLEEASEKSSSVILRAVRQLTASHRLVTRNFFNLRQIGLKSLFKQFLFYEAINLFKRLSPVANSLRHRIAKRVSGYLPQELRREFMSKEEQWKKGLSPGDTPFSKPFWYLRAGLLGKRVVLAGMVESVTTKGADWAERVATFFVDDGNQVARSGFTRLLKKAGSLSLPLFVKLCVAYYTFMRLDAACQNNWQKYLTKNYIEFRTLLDNYIALPSRSKKRRAAEEELKAFITQGHKPVSNGILLEWLRKKGIAHAGDLDEKVVAKASMLMAARAGAVSVVYIFRMLYHLARLVWRCGKLIN